MDVRVSDDPSAATAEWIARRLRDAIARRGAATLAVSGGSSAPPMLATLADADVAWAAVTVWQVDERIAPDHDPARNASQLTVLPAEATLRPMPVTADDLATAARRYGSSLPALFDVVHLGVGDDGHTASWPPGDPVVDCVAPCALVGEFNGWRRMTLTPTIVNLARARIVLVAGAAKALVVDRWMRGDPALPITQVQRRNTWVFLDPDALTKPQARR